MYFTEDKVTSLNLYKFLKQRANVYVKIPGCIKEFDEIVGKFLKSKDKRSDLVNEAEKLYNEVKDEKVRYEIITFFLIALVTIYLTPYFGLAAY